MGNIDLDKALAWALRIAQHAGDIAQSMTGQCDVRRKADNSPVTQVDLEIQQTILDAVARDYPDFAFIGEETLDHYPPQLPRPEQAQYCWVADPLDGTRNYVHGLPVSCTAIALLAGSIPLVGVTYQHGTRWTCTAVRGQGTLCNAQPTCVAKNGIGRDTLIAVPSSRRQPINPIISDWLDRYVLRNVGSTALHMAYVACGAVDAAICYECKLWDIAAGALLITESGGRLTDLRGRDALNVSHADYYGQNLPFFAASPYIYDALYTDVDHVARDFS